MTLKEKENEGKARKIICFMVLAFWTVQKKWSEQCSEKQIQ